uniref:Cupin type-2 domain-containing protein n=1 Tax=Araucaria cunninghamii TaxID=56994 RepID=A0A0D6R5G1_ARACU
MDQVSISASQFHALTMQNVKIVQPGEGISLWFFGMLVTLKALANETGDSYTLYEVMVPPGQSLPKHIRTHEDETYYMLDGELIWIVGDQEFYATKGSFVHLPRFVPRTFKNKTNRTAYMLCSCAPGGFEKYFLSFGKMPSTSDSLPPEYTDDEIDLAFKMAEEYGILFVGHQNSSADSLIT